MNKNRNATPGEYRVKNMALAPELEKVQGLMPYDLSLIHI